MIKRIVDLNDSVLVMLNVNHSPILVGGEVKYDNEAEKITNLKNYVSSVDFLIPEDGNEHKYERITLSMHQIKKIVEAATNVESEPPFAGYYDDLPF